MIGVRTAEIRGKPARNKTHSIARNDECRRQQGIINLCCNLGGTKSATSIGATKEQGLPGAMLSVASPILRLFPNLASSPDAVPHDRLYSVMQFG